jgi:hypothetical protein
MRIKLTEIQKTILSPLITQLNKAEADYERALLLIIGRPFKNYKIEGDEFVFEEVEPKEENGTGS